MGAGGDGLEAEVGGGKEEGSGWDVGDDLELPADLVCTTNNGCLTCCIGSVKLRFLFVYSIALQVMIITMVMLVCRMWEAVQWQQREASCLTRVASARAR